MLAAGLAVAAVVCPGLCAAEDAEERTVDVLSYNVHGLFPLAAKDDPRDRMPSIGWLSRPYEVVMYQEDFEYNAILSQQLEHHRGFLGNGAAVGDARRVLAKLVALPFTVLIPHFSPPYGAGVSTFVGDDLDVVGSAKHHYKDCHGWFGANGDCWAAKGYLKVSVTTEDGAEFDVYNTHLEAGPTSASTKTRRKQLAQLERAIEAMSTGRSVIVAGDFNIDYIRPRDRTMITEFRERLGLDDSGAGPETPYWRERDYILYRDGDSADLTLVDSGEALEFTSAGRSLSDHPALFASFSVRRIMTNEVSEDEE